MKAKAVGAKGQAARALLTHLSLGSICAVAGPDEVPSDATPITNSIRKIRWAPTDEVLMQITQVLVRLEEAGCGMILHLVQKSCYLFTWTYPQLFGQLAAKVGIHIPAKHNKELAGSQIKYLES